MNMNKMLNKANIYDFYQYPFFSSSKCFNNDYSTQKDKIANITSYVFHIKKILFIDVFLLVFNFLSDGKFYLFSINISILSK